MSSPQRLQIGENPLASCLDEPGLAESSKRELVEQERGRIVRPASAVIGPANATVSIPPSLAADGAGLEVIGTMLYMRSAPASPWRDIGVIPGMRRLSLTGIDCVNASVSFVDLEGESGGVGELLTTLDGGRTWTAIATPAGVEGTPSFAAATTGPSSVTEEPTSRPTAGWIGSRRRLHPRQTKLDRYMDAVEKGMDPTLYVERSKTAQRELVAAREVIDGPCSAVVTPLDEAQRRELLNRVGDIVDLLRHADPDEPHGLPGAWASPRVPTPRRTRGKFRASLTWSFACRRADVSDLRQSWSFGRDGYRASTGRRSRCSSHGRAPPD